jgi:Fic family protein
MAQLPIMHSHRPEYGWVQKLERLREAYETAVAAEPGRVERDALRLDAWLVYHSLKLKGEDVTLEEVESTRAGAGGRSAVTGVLDAVARVRRAAEGAEELTPELLLELNGTVDPEAGGRLRTAPPMAVYAGHTAPDAASLEALVPNATEWFLATSFREELHPVEQAALALIRICDLQPFPSNNELTARVAASLFPLRSGWPPMIVREELEEVYRKAILHAMHMDTMPAVELLARCVARTYDDLLGWGVHGLVDGE